MWVRSMLIWWCANDIEIEVEVEIEVEIEIDFEVDIDIDIEVVYEWKFLNKKRSAYPPVADQFLHFNT